MEIISFPFYFLLYLILAIALAKWFASRLRHQATAGAGCFAPPSAPNFDARAMRTRTPARLDGWLCIIERDLRDCQNGGDTRDLLDHYRFWREHWSEMNGPGVQGWAKNE
jgi:hypothetical protein